MNALDDKIDPLTGEIVTPQRPTETLNDKSIRSFSVFLANLEGGVFNADLSKELQNMIAEMCDHQTSYGAKAVPGKISIDLSFSLEDGMVKVRPDFKMKGPSKPGRGNSMFWVTPENNLTQEHPKQRNFEFGGNTRQIRD